MKFTQKAGLAALLLGLGACSPGNVPQLRRSSTPPTPIVTLTPKPTPQVIVKRTTKDLNDPCVMATIPAPNKLEVVMDDSLGGCVQLSNTAPLRATNTDLSMIHIYDGHKRLSTLPVTTPIPRYETDLDVLNLSYGPHTLGIVGVDMTERTGRDTLDVFAYDDGRIVAQDVVKKDLMEPHISPIKAMVTGNGTLNLAGAIRDDRSGVHRVVVSRKEGHFGKESLIYDSGSIKTFKDVVSLADIDDLSFPVKKRTKLWVWAEDHQHNWDQTYVVVKP